MVREAVEVWAPLCVALLFGALAGIATVWACGPLGMELPERLRPFPVIGFVVLFGFRGAIGSAQRLGHLLRCRDPFRPGVRR